MLLCSWNKRVDVWIVTDLRLSAGISINKIMLALNNINRKSITEAEEKKSRSAQLPVARLLINKYFLSKKKIDKIEKNVRSAKLNSKRIKYCGETRNNAFL